MNQSPYVRNDLPATRDGSCDPACEVELRLSVLADLLEGWAPHGPEHHAYDLLATTAWLERVRPEALGALDSDDLVGQARRRLEAEGEALAELATRVPDPDAWLEEAEGLRASYETLIGPAERAELACRLFNDLDDAELVRHVAFRLGVRDPELERGLDRCREWFANHPDLFLAAGAFIQALGQAVRPDLPRTNPELARTADPIVWALDALEDMESELAFEGAEPIQPEALWPLIEVFASGRPLVHLGPDREETVADSGIGREIGPTSCPFQAQSVFSHSVVHLAAEGDAPPFVPQACAWRSPDGRFLAALELFSAPASDQEAVTIAFLDREYRPAREFVGQVAQLVNCSVSIERVEQHVVARFTWGELRRLVGDLRLFVGPNLEEWEPLGDAI